LKTEEAKVAVSNEVLVPTLLYGSKTWIARRIICVVFRVIRVDKTRNAEVLNRCKVTRSVSTEYVDGLN